MSKEAIIQKDFPLVFPFEYKYSFAYRYRGGGGYDERSGCRAEKIKLHDGSIYTWDDCHKLTRRGFNPEHVRLNFIKAEEIGEKNAEVAAKGIHLQTIIVKSGEDREYEEYTLKINTPEALPLVVTFSPFSRDGNLRPPCTTTIQIVEGKILVIEDNPKL